MSLLSDSYKSENTEIATVYFMVRGEFKKGWRLLYTYSKQERIVSEQLTSMNSLHYLPMVKAIRKWSDRVKSICTPLFPSYIFVYLENEKEYIDSLNAKGVLHYVKFGDQIALVNDYVIKDLRILIGTGDPIEVAFTNFEKGQSLTILDGPLAGLACEVVRYKNKEMILVRVSLLKRSVLIELPAHHLSVH